MEILTTQGVLTCEDDSGKDRNIYNKILNVKL